MRAVEPGAGDEAPPGVALGACPADIVELVALREREYVLKALTGRRGVSLPHFGRLAAAGDTLALCVRPQRWLLLSAPLAPGLSASAWQEPCVGMAAVVDLSSALVAVHLSGARAREALARSCRLDLDPEVFPPGHAAATIMAQVGAILAAVPGGMLILTPASTARHLREWLASAARPFGLAPRAEISVAALAGVSHP